MILLGAAESRELDRLTQEKYGVPSYTLMTRAGEAVADALARRWPGALAKGVLVIAGKGNNGGDGAVAARRLIQLGGRVRSVLLARTSELKGDAARAWSDLTAIGGAVTEATSQDELVSALEGENPGAVVDAIFGTGLNAPVAGLPSRAIDAINRFTAPVVAVDISSGINSDTGAIMGAAVRAKLTVTFGFAKYGHVSYPGAEFCGALETVDIGFAPAAISDVAPTGRFTERGDVVPLLERRSDNTHKGTYGHPLIIAGSKGKGGAALLASRGALRMGSGLVTAAIPESVYAIVAAGQAELMSEAMPEHDGNFDAAATIARMEEILPGKTALVVGPGIGVSDDTKRLVAWLVNEGTEQRRPLLIDADGLNVVSAIGPAMLKAAKGPVVLTPHPGEAARLLHESSAAVNADRIGAARRLSELTDADVLLKGAHTVIAGKNGAVSINSSGNPGMATAGMGDVLSGIIGSLLGRAMNPRDALAMGAFVHGYAGDRLAHRLGPYGFLSGELADELPQAIRALMS